MKLIQIEYFIAVAKHLNFTAAAQSLFITQPNLSKQISLLEQELGVKLIYRNKRVVQLTPAGEYLYKEAGKFFSDFQSIIDKTKEISRENRDRLSIGCIETTNIDMFFPPVIRQFTEAYPHIELVIERGSFKKIREGLLDDTYDIIFTLSFDVIKIDNLCLKNIHPRNGSLVLSKNNPLAQKENFSVNDLENQNYYIHSKSESPGLYELAINNAKKYNFKNPKEVANMETLLSNIELGLGFAILDKSIGKHRSNSFIFYDLPEPDDQFYLCCAWKKKIINTTIPLFVELINEIP